MTPPLPRLGSFGDDLERARKERTPVMALRFEDPPNTGELDDVVVQDVKMFRAEAMGDGVWWMACYFHNDERVTFHVVPAKEDDGSGTVSVTVTETPSEWIDWDKHPEARHA